MGLVLGNTQRKEMCGAASSVVHALKRPSLCWHASHVLENAQALERSQTALPFDPFVDNRFAMAQVEADIAVSPVARCWHQPSSQLEATVFAHPRILSGLDSMTHGLCGPSICLIPLPRPFFLHCCLEHPQAYKRPNERSRALNNMTLSN